MCSLARPSSALGCFDAAAFLDRRRGVAAVAPVACGVMAREPPVRRAGAEASSAARTQKRARDSLDGKAGVRKGVAAGEVSVGAPAPSGQQRLQERMRAELDAVRALHRKAVLLCRGGAGTSGGGGAPPAAKGDARREAPLEAAAKRRKASPPGSAAEASPLKRAPEAAQQSRETVKEQQQRPVVQRATPLPTKPSAANPLDKAREILKRRRLEEMAQAREKFRQEVLEMEKAAMPDETVYPRDLQELGIAFEYAVTRTRRQAACVPG
ncbi:unnamed protein product [Urochloa decumbens]|uniref:Uncharacterized protein n=1 Tax=Urochloa decumbens TaxID=240449 RepID=A0ABC8WDW2_9POAL